MGYPEKELACILARASRYVESDFSPKEEKKSEDEKADKNIFMPEDRGEKKKRKPRSPKPPPPPLRAVFNAMCEFYVDTTPSSIGLDALRKALDVLDAREGNSHKASEEIEKIVKAYTTFRKVTIDAMKSIGVMVKALPDNSEK